MYTREIVSALVSTTTDVATKLADQAAQVLFSDSENRPYVSERAQRLRQAHAHSHVKIFIEDDLSDSDELDVSSYASDTDADISDSETSEDEQTTLQSSNGSVNSPPLAESKVESTPVTISEPTPTVGIVDELADKRRRILGALMLYIASRDNNESCLTFMRNAKLTEDKVGIARNLFDLMRMMNKTDVSLQNVAVARQENKQKERKHGKKHYFFTSCGLLETLDTVEKLLTHDPKTVLQQARAKKQSQNIEALQSMRMMR
jgi:hypothetical protein